MLPYGGFSFNPNFPTCHLPSNSPPGSPPFQTLVASPRVSETSENRRFCAHQRALSTHPPSLPAPASHTQRFVSMASEQTQMTAGGLLAKQMVAGGLAGMLADGVVYPMMTVKSRLQVQGAAVGASSGGGTSALYMYRGPVHAIYTISAHEGWRTLYKGYATVSQIAPAQALYMASYQTSKRLLPGGENNPIVHFCGGVIATVVQSLVTVPIEVIRQRQMVQRSGSDSYKGSLHAATKIYQVEGLRALYRGFGLAQMVWGPYNAIYLPLWEATKRAAAHYSGVESVHKLDVHWELLSSFFSASCAALITNPMDVIKTRLQVQGKSNASNNTQYTGAIDAARSILQKEGFKGFTCGISSRVFWIAPSSMIMFTCFDQLMKRL